MRYNNTSCSNLVLDSLYCSEQHWEKENQDELESELEQNDIMNEHDLVWDDEELSSLLAKQQKNPLSASILQAERNPIALARRHGVQWILQASAHHCFSVVTSVLAVNYLDRFLASFHFQKGKPWMIHLSAITCLSLAAKVEETRMPLLLHLQEGLEQSGYVFEANTIKRMEILVLSTLEWKMNPVTPVSFLDYFVRRVGLKGHLCLEFLKRCEAILLSVIDDSRFTNYLPSVLATAILIHVVKSRELGFRVNQNQLFHILRIHQKEEKVEECYKVMLEEIERKSSAKIYKKRKFGWIDPGSPNSVMDASSSLISSVSSSSYIGDSV